MVLCQCCFLTGNSSSTDIWCQREELRNLKKPLHGSIIWLDIVLQHYFDYRLAVCSALKMF